MSKNTNIAEFINYVSIDGSGNVVATTGIKKSGGTSSQFLKADGSVDASTYATQTYVTTAISNLVASSPATLDTLNELALALGSDPNFATTVATSIGTKQPQLNGTGFVKVTGTTVSYDNSTYALDSAVVKLTGTQTISGVKTFTGAGNTFTQNTNFQDRIYLKSSSTNDYTNLSGHTNQLLVGVIGATHILSFPENTNYTYTFPAVSGTVALTSNLSSYVPYTGANADVVLGTNNLKSKNTFVEGDGSYNGGGLRIKQYVSQADGIDNYNTISSQSSGFAFSSSFGGGIFKNFILDASSLTNTTQRVYTLPDASGTLALTSNLSSYLPLTGGTLTGALNAPSASFSGAASVINTFNLYKTGGTTLGGQLAYDSAVNQLYLWNNISSGYFSIYVNGSEALKISSNSTATFSSTVSATGGISTLGSFTSTVSGTSELRLQGGGYGVNYNTSLRSITGAVGVLQFGNNGENYVLIGNTATSANTYLSFRVNSTTEATSSGTEAFRITSTGVGNSSISIPNGTLYMPSSIGGRTSQIEFGNLTSGDILGIPNATSTFYLSYGSGYIQFRNDAAGEVLRLKNDANVAVTNKLTVGGSIRASNSVYNWFQAGTNSWDGYQYLHLKTNMSSGANGNVDHTMSLFTGRLYSYSSAYIREGSFGFHNWSGGIYNPVLTGNFWAGAYGSSDGYVVLIVALGGGSYMGLNIDWHQSYPYGFRDRIVTSYNHSNSSASLY